jgi:serine/threonine protein phosphatase 1
MHRTFVIGDIHGACRALRQCLDRAAFDYEQDELISLGDICDGWPETKACIDELLKIRNLIVVLGNHDFWTREWMQSGFREKIWMEQGGLATTRSYAAGIPQHHRTLLEDARPYYIRENKLFVHAGIEPKQNLRFQGLDTFLWNRTLARMAYEFHLKEISVNITGFTEVYLGHTPIPHSQPIQACEIWLMDTGAGWSGVLSMMDIHTKQVFTSDPVPSLYPDAEGRKKRI